jgi:hypothetical protein
MPTPARSPRPLDWWVPKPRSVVRHFKGGLYWVVKVVTSSQGNTMVVYRNQKGEEFRASANKFNQEVCPDDALLLWVPRFQLLNEDMAFGDFEKLDI